MIIKKTYGIFLKIITIIFGVDTAKTIDARIRDKKRINLKKPVTLSDKVSYIELHDQSPLAAQCTDKYAVREYVKSKGLENILIPLAYDGYWTRADDINFEDLPDSFILKATHGCKMNYAVPEKRKLDYKLCMREVEKWLQTTYGTYSMEPHYMNIPHRVYAEHFLGDIEKINDYKFHCLNGVPQFVLVCSNRKTNGDKAMQVTLDIFDMDWNWLDDIVKSGSEKPGDGNVNKPVCFNEMKEVAKTLSADFKFVRVDLYEYNGKVLFGELTFTPAHCVFPYLTDKFNIEMGKRLTI